MSMNAENEVKKIIDRETDACLIFERKDKISALKNLINWAHPS